MKLEIFLILDPYRITRYDRNWSERKFTTELLEIIGF